MSVGPRVAGCFCLVLLGGVASLPAASPEGGLRLDRLSNGHRRIWRAVEKVVGESDATGAPRSPTLRRLLEWARSTPHVLHVEMVPRSRMAAGTAGIFRLEAVDPAGLQHTAVIRLCPRNIERAKVGAAPDAAHSFVRFAG